MQSRMMVIISRGMMHCTAWVCAILMFLGMGLLIFMPQGSKAADGVPDEYYANYQIIDQWNAMLSAFEQIQAAVRVGTNPQPEKFSNLQTAFNALFPYFPQTPSWKVIYNQCQLTVQGLTSQYDASKYVVFKDKCFVPLNDILRAISSDYTVRPVVKAMPNKGPAPLNVTLDARDSQDAPFSNDTIPEANFFWRYKNVDGKDVAIGQGPVLNHTFDRPGNYVVHVTVRSANNRTKGIFDGETSLSVNVAPKSANIALYINGELASESIISKIGTEDAKKGIRLDGTSTTPVGGRKILRYSRTITAQNDPKFIVKREAEGGPDEFIQEFPRNGLYTIVLEVIDNENNKISSTYKVSVSDPVSSIKFSPSQGDTSSTYSFDATASYSLTSRIKKYQRILSDKDGNQIDVYETKQFKRVFKQPGEYTIKLTVTDELGNTSYDVQQFYVDSTPPLPSFIIRSVTDLKRPSQFVLDAGGSYDEDVRNGYDELSYSWSFSPKEGVIIDQSLDNGKIAVVSFNQKGTYTVQLTLKDKFQKTVDMEKEIKVESTVRPSLAFSPQQAVMRGETLGMEVTANKPIAYVERSFGDSQTQKTNTSKVTHAYASAGAYKMTAKVYTPSGEENQVMRMVFVGQKDEPTAAYEVRTQATNLVLLPEGSCGTGEQAYIVDRYQKIVIDATLSRGVKGSQLDALGFVFKTQEGTEQRQKSLSHNFSELGCQYVDVFVEDKLVAKTDIKRIWFDVRNALPNIDYLTVSFPQYADKTSIAVSPVATSPINEPAGQNILSTKFLDPVTVRVTAANVRDPDGFINRYVRYYVKANDPENLLDIKYTPASVPYAVFSIPRQGGTDFEFGVRVIDSDGGEVDSRDYFGQGPLVSFPPDDNNPDVPIVTMKANASNIQVGDEVTFTTTSTILSKKADFEATRYFKFDFDGDGIYDRTTNQDTVSYIYTKPSPEKKGYKPKVKVFYRERAGTAFTEAIFVRARLQPKLLYTSYDTVVLFQPTVLGDTETRELCLDIRRCMTDETYVNTGSEESFVFKYPAPGSYSWRFFVMDRYGNQKSERNTLTLTAAKTGEQMAVLSIPEARPQGSGFEISVGNSLKNTVSLYVIYSGAGNCYVDRDITKDSDGDGEILYDKDVACNELAKREYSPRITSTVARIYYAASGAVASSDITIQFLDVDMQLTGEDKEIYDKIDVLINHVSSKSLDEISTYYKTLLIGLRDGLGDKEQTTSFILQLYDVLQKNPSAVTTQDKEELERILAELSDGSVVAALGGNEYDTAKKDILLRFKGDAKELIMSTFQEFDAYEGTGGKEERKKILDTILQTALSEQQEGNLDEVDVASITSRLCDIIRYYELPSKSCGTGTVEEAPVEEVQEQSSQKSVLAKVLTRVLRIVGVLGIAFVGLIVLFAIKAKRQKQLENPPAE